LQNVTLAVSPYFLNNRTNLNTFLNEVGSVLLIFIRLDDFEYVFNVNWGV